MAEAAANSYVTSEAAPSIFEVIAQKSLNVTLEPALQKVAELLANCYPKYCFWVNKYYDETFLVLHGLLQYHYLKNHSASFAEYFYGLQRVRLDNNELSKRQEHISWIYIVIIPYIKRKIDAYMTELRLQKADQTLTQDISGKLKKLLIHLHSAFELTWGSWILINYLRYMSNQSESQLPALRLLNLKLIYSNVDDNFQTFWTSLLQGELSWTQISVGLVQNAVRSTMEISAFFVQFLQAWNSERANLNVKALPVVEPPPLHNEAHHYQGKCPICLQPWKIPTVLPVSGYVFCFTCIYRCLRQTAACPITKLPALPLDVVRLYA